MSSAQIKDHYRILEVAPNATADDIKKAYRALAMQYHPDTNANEYAAAHFRDIAEAYSILGNEHKRRKYDEERWLSGMSNRAKEQAVITPAWILQEAKRLSKHMATVDTYRMSHSALYDYVCMLLNDNHMAVLLHANDESTNEAIATELIHATRHLKHEYMQPIADMAAKLVMHHNDILTRLYRQTRSSYARSVWDKYMPLVIVIITVLLCFAMFLWGRR
ncbi:MAG: J domain-containing protein [Bacteroidetes bacterium]|nr:J domain-containing protein [Bacteroidota bacterium]